MVQTTRRAILAALAAAGTGAGAWASVAAPPASDIRLQAVNPELRPIAAAMLKQFGSIPDLSAATLPGMRKMMTGVSPPPAATPMVAKRTISGLRGQPSVTVYVINAKPSANRPVIVHTHGGGFVMDDAADAIGSLQPIASTLDCAIVTVDYRLAPEASWAGSLEDNYAALKWVCAHAAELGVDTKRIAVMGESAGGGHAALLAIAARDRGEVPVAFQCLIYPMLDDRTGSTVTPPAPIGQLAWTAPNNRFGWRAFLGQPPGTAAAPAKAVPARLTDLRGLPPAFIGVGSIDLFVDEDVTYAHRLIDAGVATELMVVPGAFHGFDVAAPQTTLVKRFTEAKLAALRQAFVVA